MVYASGEPLSDEFECDGFGEEAEFGHPLSKSTVHNGTKYQQVEVFFDGQLLTVGPLYASVAAVLPNGKTPFKIGLDGDDRIRLKE